jgi:hypothetical protein
MRISQRGITKVIPIIIANGYVKECFLSVGRNLCSYHKFKQAFKKQLRNNHLLLKPLVIYTERDNSQANAWRHFAQNSRSRDSSSTENCKTGVGGCNNSDTYFMYDEVCVLLKVSDFSNKQESTDDCESNRRPKSGSSPPRNPLLRILTAFLEPWKRQKSPSKPSNQSCVFPQTPQVLWKLITNRISMQNTSVIFKPRTTGLFHHRFGVRPV